MCEPFHSIVQFPDQDNQGDSTRGLLGSIIDWGESIGKRVKSWFHFSKMGSGHSKGIAVSGKASLILPNHSRYEALWWDRRVKLDGQYMGEALSKAEALECAEYYANQVSIGSLQQLRRFLEVSIVKSDRPRLYVDSARDKLFNKEGRIRFESKLSKILGKRRFTLSYYDDIVRQRVIKLILGITRKRDLLCDSWADDDSLWVPQSAR